jgi:two-component system nitrogen regulation response regulator GlnG
MAPGQTVEVKDLPYDLTHGKEGGGDINVPFVAAEGNGAANGQGGAPLAMPANGAALPAMSAAGGWIGLLELQAATMLSDGQSEVMDVLGRQFESALIKTALKHTHGRKNDAAVRLGIGRNTITRKIAELGIDGAKDE